MDQGTLMNITKINISYLSHLDYVDLLNLCKINKSYAFICEDDRMLRDIIYTKDPNVIITPYFKISKALKDLYSQFFKLINDNYNTLPEWVNKTQFIDYTVRTMGNVFVNELMEAILDNDSYVNNINNIHLDKMIIALPFVSDHFSSDLYGSDSIFDNIPNKIIITDNIKKYIEPLTIKYNNLESTNNYWKLHKILNNLFLI